MRSALKSKKLSPPKNKEFIYYEDKNFIPNKNEEEIFDMFNEKIFSNKIGDIFNVVNEDLKNIKENIDVKDYEQMEKITENEIKKGSSYFTIFYRLWDFLKRNKSYVGVAAISSLITTFIFLYTKGFTRGDLVLAKFNIDKLELYYHDADDLMKSKILQSKLMESIK